MSGRETAGRESIPGNRRRSPIDWSQWIITYLGLGQELVDAFVTDANGHLYVNYWDGLAWHWADQGPAP